MLRRTTALLDPPPHVHTLPILRFSKFFFEAVAVLYFWKIIWKQKQKWLENQHFLRVFSRFSITWVREFWAVALSKLWKSPAASPGANHLPTHTHTRSNRTYCTPPPQTQLHSRYPVFEPPVGNTRTVHASPVKIGEKCPSPRFVRTGESWKFIIPASVPNSRFIGEISRWRFVGEIWKIFRFTLPRFVGEMMTQGPLVRFCRFSKFVTQGSLVGEDSVR
jgi:hypothetical protein